MLHNKLESNWIAAAAHLEGLWDNSTWIVATASTAPAAPSRWPIIDFVELTRNWKHGAATDKQLKWKPERNGMGTVFQ